MSNKPMLMVFAKNDAAQEIVFAFDRALENLLQINTRPYSAEYPQRCSLLPQTGSFIRAGAKYEKPWTRDASLNCWNAASLLCPQLAENTLFAVCEDTPEGTRIQEDNQWWDRLIWLVAAWEHYVITGDDSFLTKAYPVAKLSFARAKQEYFNEKWGLFRGPAFMEDGISSYPEPVFREGVNNPFVLRYEKAHHILCLSTNCAYYGAAKALSAMAQRLGDGAAAAEYAAFAATLKQAILRHLRSEDGSFGYFLYGEGAQEGQLEHYQEALGISFGVLFGVVEGKEAARLIENVHVDPVGIVSVYPHFARFGDGRRGRHNGCYWPMIGGFFADAAARCGHSGRFAQLLQQLAGLVKAHDGNFYELYHPITGEPDGGWQIDAEGYYHYPPYPHQTWSATAYLRMVLLGLFGMRFEPDGLRFAPMVPKDWDGAALEGLCYRDMELNIRIHGSGSVVESFALDGKPRKSCFLPPQLTGKHCIDIIMKAQ